MPADPPSFLLDRTLLQQKAGEQSFARGEQYFEDGLVRQIQCWLDRVSARVEGTRSYRVRLWQSRQELQWSCTCPLGRESVFCKHAVAVGLAWLDRAGKADDGATPNRPGAHQDDEQRRERIAHYLQGISPERLVGLLLEATDYDDILRRRLLLECIGVARTHPGKKPRKGTPPPDLDAYRQILREAIETHDYVDYDALPDYAQSAEEAIAPLGELLHMGQAAAVIELAEYALIELDRAAEMLDGGDGSLNRVYDHLQNVHLEACRLAKPDPEALAARLLNYELEGGLGVFNNAAKAYAEVLGPQGLAVWREKLTAQWAEATAPQPKRHTDGKPAPIDHRLFQLQALMESLAEAEGDVDRLIAIKSRDLSSPHDFLALAELCRTANRSDDALQWARRGARKFTKWPDASGLRDFLVTELHRAGRDEEALEIAWQDFVRSNTLENFQRLRQQAKVTPGGWPAYRERALTQLRGHIKKAQKNAKRNHWLAPPDHSAVVEILLDEKAVDEAWQEAQTGGCHAGLWLQLAAKREKFHPADALGVYRARLEPTIAQGGQTAYKEAVGLMKKMRALLTRLGRPEEFTVYREEIRAKHSRKRSFLKLLDAAEP